MLKPNYIKLFIENQEEIFNHLQDELTWLEVTPARKEYFMSDQPKSYTYGTGNFARQYSSSNYSNPVKSILNKLNQEFNCQYNVCFLNRYDTFKQQLGWHSDDSPEMNPLHDIAVISFGAEREIWWKKKDQKGTVLNENKQLLHNGSLFVMPAGFQEIYFHRIPKSDHQCSTRISLTFRNYID